MAFYIVQHGLSLPKNTDPEQGLAPEGHREVARIAQVAQNYGVRIDLIQHSVKKRARQTAEILAEYLHPQNGIQEITGVKPLDDVAAYASRVDFDAPTLLVGHLPFLERLTSYLIAGASTPTLFKLQNGGILCLDRFEGLNTPAIKWALMPNVD